MDGDVDVGGGVRVEECLADLSVVGVGVDGGLLFGFGDVV